MTGLPITAMNPDKMTQTSLQTCNFIPLVSARANIAVSHQFQPSQKKRESRVAMRQDDDTNPAATNAWKNSICLIFQQSKNPTPHSCSQFVSHEVVYIPKNTLIANGSTFTEVTRLELELLTILRYTYQQGFSCAANDVCVQANVESTTVRSCTSNAAKDVARDFDLNFAKSQSDEAEDSTDSDIR